MSACILNLTGGYFQKFGYRVIFPTDIPQGLNFQSHVTGKLGLFGGCFRGLHISRLVGYGLHVLMDRLVGRLLDGFNRWCGWIECSSIRYIEVS